MDDDWEEIEALMFGGSTKSLVRHDVIDDREYHFVQNDTKTTDMLLPLSVSNLQNLQLENDVDIYSDIEDTSDTESTSKSSQTTLTDSIYPYAKDDSSAEAIALYHVDYLAHNWESSQDDFWLTWQHLERSQNDELPRARLRNALWRSWAKGNGQLETMPPEKIAWTKDSDSTWLYGPLHHKAPESESRPSTVTSCPSHIIASAEEDLQTKPRSILKKRTTKEIILGLPASSLRLTRCVTL